MSQKHKILSMLRGGRPIKSWMIAEYCLQYNARIKELRARGILIEKCMIGNQHAFKLVTPLKEIDFKKCKLKEAK